MSAAIEREVSCVSTERAAAVDFGAKIDLALGLGVHETSDRVLEPFDRYVFLETHSRSFDLDRYLAQSISGWQLVPAADTEVCDADR